MDSGRRLAAPLPVLSINFFRSVLRNSKTCRVQHGLVGRSNALSGVACWVCENEAFRAYQVQDRLLIFVNVLDT